MANGNEGSTPALGDAQARKLWRRSATPTCPPRGFRQAQEQAGGQPTFRVRYCVRIRGSLGGVIPRGDPTVVLPRTLLVKICRVLG